MTVAIETRYVGATDTKGSRIIATTGNGHRLILPYPHELSGEACHRKAAEQLATDFGWLKDGRRLVSGSTARGWVFVFVEESRQ